VADTGTQTTGDGSSEMRRPKSSVRECRGGVDGHAAAVTRWANRLLPAVLFIAGMLLPAMVAAVSLQTAFDQLLCRLDAQKPRSGTVLKAHYTTAYIDRGLLHGVKIGDRYDIVKDVVEVRNAVTAEVTARRRVIAGKLEVRHVQDQNAACELVEGKLMALGDDGKRTRVLHSAEAGKNAVALHELEIGTGLVVTMSQFREALQAAVGASEHWRLVGGKQAGWQLQATASVVADQTRLSLTLVNANTGAVAAEAADLYDITTAPPSQRMGERLAAAMTLVQDRRWQEAVDEFDRVLKGIELRELGEVDVRKVGLAPEQWASYADAIRNSARTRRDYECACDYYRYCIALDGDNPLAWTSLAYTIGKFLGDLDSARQFYDAGLKACGGRDALFVRDRQMWEFEEIRLACERGTIATGAAAPGLDDKRTADDGATRVVTADIDVPALVAAFEHESEATRSLAIRQLASLGRDAPFAELIARAAAPSATVQACSIQALQGLGDAALQALIRALQQESSELRVGAELALTQMGEPAALEILKAVADVPDETRGYFVRILARLGDQASPFLVRALRCRDQASLTVAIEAMLQMGDPPVAELVAALADPAPRVGKNAVRALSRLGNRAVAELIRAFRHDDPRIRADAVRIFTSMKPPPVAILVRALGLRGSKDIRENAALTLSRIQPPPVDALVESLAHDDSYLRKNAASLLGLMEAEAAIAPLSKLLTQDPSIDVRCAAATALGRMGADAAVPGLVDALAVRDEDIQFSAISALGRIGGQRAAQALLTVLSSDSGDMRSYAAEALGNARYAGAVGPLVDVLQRDEDVFVRRSAAEALGQIGTSTAAEALGNALHDAPLRDKAKAALITMGEEATEILIHALRSREATVRQRAAEALGSIGDARAAKPLCALLNDESLVRASARDALVAIGRPALAELRNTYSDLSGRVNARSASGRSGEMDRSLLALQATSEAMKRIKAREQRGQTATERPARTAGPSPGKRALSAYTARGSFRKWHFADGRDFTGRFVSAKDGAVQLEDADGRVRSVSLHSLSADDQKWLRAYQLRNESKR